MFTNFFEKSLFFEVYCRVKRVALVKLKAPCIFCTASNLQWTFCNSQSPIFNLKPTQSRIKNAKSKGILMNFLLCIWEASTKQQFFIISIWVFFHEHSQSEHLQSTRQQARGEIVSLTPLYHVKLLHKNLDISRVITVESFSLHIDSSRTRTGDFWFLSAIC